MGEEIFGPGYQDAARRVRPFLGRLRFLEQTERDACEKVVAFQGLSEEVCREEFARMCRAQRLRSRLLNRFYVAIIKGGLL